MASTGARNRGRRGLGDIKTALVTHLPTKPPRKGDTALQLYLLVKEREMIENRLSCLERTQGHLRGRLQEVLKGVAEGQEKLREEFQPDEAGGEGKAPTSPLPVMCLEY